MPLGNGLCRNILRCLNGTEFWEKSPAFVWYRWEISKPSTYMIKPGRCPMRAALLSDFTLDVVLTDSLICSMRIVGLSDRTTIHPKMGWGCAKWLRQRWLAWLSARPPPAYWWQCAKLPAFMTHTQKQKSIQIATFLQIITLVIPHVKVVTQNMFLLQVDKSLYNHLGVLLHKMDVVGAPLLTSEFFVVVANPRSTSRSFRC